MLDEQSALFKERIHKIDAQHASLAKGYVKLVERDGLLVPEKSRFKRRRFPLPALMALLVGFMLFKAVLFGQVGATRYTEQIAILSQSSPLDQAGAWLMQPDPVTQWFARLFTR